MRPRSRARLRAKKKQKAEELGRGSWLNGENAVARGFVVGRNSDEKRGRCISPPPFPGSSRKRERPNDDPPCAFFFSFLSFAFCLLFLFENTLVGNRALRLQDDLQSSTPEEYLDGRVLADEAGLGNGPLAVEGDGSFPA